MFLSLLEVQHCTCVTVVLHTFVMLYVCTMWHMGCLWRSCVSRRVIQSIVSEPVLLKYEISPLAYSNFIHNFVYNMLYTSSAYIGFQCSFIPVHLVHCSSPTVMVLMVPTTKRLGTMWDLLSSNPRRRTRKSEHMI